MLTIIIPTMNRSEFLIRLLNYYADANYKHHITIGDSSNSFHAEKTKDEIKKIGVKLKITYKEYPGESCFAVQKQLIQSVTTPYIVSLPDDDFLVPNSLDKCIDYLETHHEYIAAHGIGAILSLEASGPYGECLGVGEYRQPKIENELASQRLLEYLMHYSASVFSVHRTGAFKVMWPDAYSSNDNPFGELLPCCLSVILGKIKQLNCFYLVRHVHDNRYLSPDMFDWITNPNWLSSYQKFSNYLVEELVKKDGIATDKAREIVKQAFWGYLNKGLVKKYNNRYIGKASLGILNVTAKLKAALKMYPVSRKALSVSRKVIRSINSRGLSLEALLSPRSSYHADFMPIYRSVAAKDNASD